MQSSGWGRNAERVCLAIFLAWLAWIPLPFGSVIERARPPLIIVPLILCMLAAGLRFLGIHGRPGASMPTRSQRIWLIGGVLFLLAGAIQVIPLAPSLLRTLSPESFAIWSSASRVATLAGEPARTAWPISVDPQATIAELFRLAALAATFLTASLLIRNHARRRMLAIVLCAAAVFETLYGLREAALQRYEIWGWVNRLIFDRVTGTFVNPNHFAHYIAIILPMAFFLGAALWYKSGGREAPPLGRMVMLLERHALLAGFTLLAVAACVAGILLAQSRGGLLAAAAGVVAVAAMLPGRRVTRVALASLAGLTLIVGLALFLGTDRTMTRFSAAQLGESAVNRRIPIETAVSLWQRFAVFGSGLGTFSRVVWMEQRADFGHYYHHAHDDYAEVAATGGTLGIVIALTALLGGYVALVRMTFGQASRELTWIRRAFQAAALASLTIAMVHALFDFNFFIPSNPPTLAAIVGAAVASLDHDKRTRR